MRQIQAGPELHHHLQSIGIWVLVFTGSRISKWSPRWLAIVLRGRVAASSHQRPGGHLKPSSQRSRCLERTDRHMLMVRVPRRCRQRDWVVVERSDEIRSKLTDAFASRLQAVG